MTTPPPEARREVKFAARETEAARMIAWVDQHPSGFREPYPPRRVNSVYFDGFDCPAYAENLTGVSDRAKIRYRWYGESRTPQAGGLELKRRRSVWGWKLVWKLAAAPHQPGGSWSEMRARINAGLPPEGRLWFDARPAATIVTRYWRRYFVSGDGRVRLTIDTAQETFDARFSHGPEGVLRTNPPDALVVEVKFGRDDVDHAGAMLQGLPIRVSRNSKYVMAVRAAAWL